MMIMRGLVFATVIIGALGGIFLIPIFVLAPFTLQSATILDCLYRDQSLLVCMPGSDGMDVAGVPESQMLKVMQLVWNTNRCIPEITRLLPHLSIVETDDCRNCWCPYHYQMPTCPPDMWYIYLKNFKRFCCFVRLRDRVILQPSKYNGETGGFWAELVGGVYH